MDYQQLPPDILDHQEIVAPTVVHNTKIVRPFEVISKVKQADVIDTTIAFACLYYSVFIIFLGDLGVGAILALLGLLMSCLLYTSHECLQPSADKVCHNTCNYRD